MNPADTVTYVEHTVDGKVHRFNKLSLNDIFQKLLPAEKVARKEKLLANLKLAGASTEIIFNELERFDETPISFDDYLKMLNTITGTMTIITYALDGDKNVAFSAEDVGAIIRKLTAGTGIEFGVKKAEETSIMDRELPIQNGTVNPSDPALDKDGRPICYGR